MSKNNESQEKRTSQNIDLQTLVKFELLVKEEIKTPANITMISTNESTVEFNHGIIAGLNRSISLLRRVLNDITSIT